MTPRMRRAVGLGMAALGLAGLTGCGAAPAPTGLPPVPADWVMAGYTPTGQPAVVSPSVGPVLFVPASAITRVAQWARWWRQHQPSRPLIVMVTDVPTTSVGAATRWLAHQVPHPGLPILLQAGPPTADVPTAPAWVTWNGHAAVVHPGWPRPTALLTALAWPARPYTPPIQAVSHAK